MVRSIDDQKTRIANLQAQLQSKSWEESLVASAILPQYSQTTHLVSKMCLALLAGLFTVVTFGLGYPLVSHVHTRYSSYQERVNTLIKQIVREQLYPSLAPSAEISMLRAAHSTFDPKLYAALNCSAIQYAKQKRKDGLNHIRVPEVIKAEWKKALQIAPCSSNDILFHQQFDSLLELPWTSQLENTQLTALDNLYCKNKISDHLAERRFKKYGTLACRNKKLEDCLDTLEQMYRIGRLVEEVYKMLPERIDLSSVDSFMWIEQKDVVVPTIYGAALIAAYYEIKFGITIHMGTSETLKRLLKDGSFTTPFGFILFKENTCLQPHVTPMILSANRQEVLHLDCLGSDPLLTLYGIEGLKKQNIKVARQADQHSCRNDAISILCNALWDMKQREMQSPLDIPEIKRSTLPPAWAKTVQRSSALKGVDLTAPVRSKSFTALKECIDAHSEDKQGKKMRLYLLQKGHSFGARIVELVQNKDAYPEIWAAFHKKLALFENNGFSLEKAPLVRRSLRSATIEKSEMPQKAT